MSYYMLDGEKIVQVIPVNVPTYAIYKGDDGKLYEDPVYYLGLSTLGRVVPLTMNEDCCYDAEECDNFIRLEERGEPGWIEVKGKK